MNDFVKLCPLSTVVPMALKFPCGVVESVEDVCATGEMFTGELPPPQYSGRWSLASGDVTLKCPFITSMYREPERACFSRNFCVANASLNWFIVAEVAVVKSATNPPIGSPENCWFPDVLDHCEIEPPGLAAIPASATVVSDPATYISQLGASLTLLIGADTPRGSVTSAPFCGQGNADVK